MGVRVVTAIHPTQVGRQVAISGLLPATVSYLLAYLVRHGRRMSELLPDANGVGGDPVRLNFCLLNSCLTSPEFSGLERTRFIPYGCEQLIANQTVERFAADLAERPWHAYRGAANASELLLHWIEGQGLDTLERRYQGLRAGGISSLAMEVSWVLSGLAGTLAVATRPELHDIERPAAMRDVGAGGIANLRQLLPTLRLLIWRLNVGLPGDVLWMSELRTDDGRPAVSRNEALALFGAGFWSFEALRQRNNWNDVVAALRNAGVREAQQRAETIQKLAHEWRIVIQQRCRDSQLSRVGERDKPLIESLYVERERAFEGAYEALLLRTGIRFVKFDDGTRVGAFDYILGIDERQELIVECKTKQGQSLVDLTAARVVLASSEQFGYGNVPCVTVCQPGVDPNVPTSLQACSRLTLVETHDLAEAFVRLLQGSLTTAGFHDWLAQPGQAKIETLNSSGLLYAEACLATG